MSGSWIAGSLGNASSLNGIAGGGQSDGNSGTMGAIESITVEVDDATRRGSGVETDDIETSGPSWATLSKRRGLEEEGSRLERAHRRESDPRLPHGSRVVLRSPIGHCGRQVQLHVDDVMLHVDDVMLHVEYSAATAK